MFFLYEMSTFCLLLQVIADRSQRNPVLYLSELINKEHCFLVSVAFPDKSCSPVGRIYTKEAVQKPLDQGRFSFKPESVVNLFNLLFYFQLSKWCNVQYISVLKAKNCLANSDC